MNRKPPCPSGLPVNRQTLAGSYIRRFIPRGISPTFLVYGGDKELVINGYVNARFDTDPDDSMSQARYVFILNGGAVSWCSSKQSIVMRSMCEVEYIAVS